MTQTTYTPIKVIKFKVIDELSTLLVSVLR